MTIQSMEIHVAIPLNTPRLRAWRKQGLPRFVLIRVNSWLNKVLLWPGADNLRQVCLPP